MSLEKIRNTKVNIIIKQSISPDVAMTWLDLADIEWSMRVMGLSDRGSETVFQRKEG